MHTDQFGIKCRNLSLGDPNEMIPIPNIKNTHRDKIFLEEA